MLTDEQAMAARLTYAHMCRDEHVQVGHNDSESERCPVCRERDRAEQAEQARDAAHAALREVEWVGSGISCPFCGNPRKWGHEPGCDIGAALAASAPQKPACDCGAALTLCVSCAVAEWQAAHPECPACCPIAPAQETERGR